MTATTPTGVSMRDLLASCAAADAISRPPRVEERPEAVRDRAEHTAAAACARAAATEPRANDGPSRHPAERPAA
ncbi:hypothetical protein ADK64_33325 [Streptomyces sp. MMG1121]|nr:hypothetical protein ADK64_33325 [Streptomyces sp. MMG1121]